MGSSVTIGEVVDKRCDLLVLDLKELLVLAERLTERDRVLEDKESIAVQIRKKLRECDSLSRNLSFDPEGYE